MKKLKVLMLGWNDEPNKVGGVGLVSQQVAKAIGAELEVDFVAPQFQIPKLPISEHQIGLYPSISLGVTAPAKRRRPSLDWHQSERKFAKHNPEGYAVIHAHDWAAFPLARKLAADWQVPLVAHFHSTEAERNPLIQDRAIAKLEGRTLTDADAVIAVSEASAARLSTQSTSAPVVLHNHWVAKQVAWVERVPEKVKRVLFIGRVTHQKGWIHFVETSAKMLSAHTNMEFWVVGEGADLRGMMEMVREKGLLSHFHFKPFVARKDLRDLFAVVDLVVFPSKSEPFGMTVWDALNAGIPVLVSQQHGILELFPKIPTADFEAADQTAAKALKILIDPNFRASCQAYYQQTLRSLDPNTQVDQLRMVYHQLTELGA